MEIPTIEILQVHLVEGELSDGLIVSVTGTDDVMTFESDCVGITSVSETVSGILTGYMEELSSGDIEVAK